MSDNQENKVTQEQFQKPEREFWYCSWTNKGDKEAWRLKKKKSNDVKYFKDQEEAIAYYMSLEIDGYLWFHANGKYVRNIKTIRSLESKETIVFDSFDSEEKQKEQERKLEEAIKRNQEILQKQWEEKQKELDQKISQVEEAKKDLELKSEAMQWKLQEMNDNVNELNESFASTQVEENYNEVQNNANNPQPENQFVQQPSSNETQLALYNPNAQTQAQQPNPQFQQQMLPAFQYPNTMMMPAIYPTNQTQYFYNNQPKIHWLERITPKVIVLTFFLSLFICLIIIALCARSGLIPWF
ncbi:hypothetical protein [Mycoplasma elephantis]|uniref:hypothetical protein n=1 Tax=Mycoplasma elephantis TaxID=114882 RepID=UPI000489F6CC|nr:hypothetical protein [Mycoplasma elephantis]